jgi:uncharacterized membrane protein YphA (DoxX/SURF4 family)
MTPTPWKSTAADFAATLTRWALGGYFLYMGLVKAVFHDAYDFLKLVDQYHLVTNPYLLNSIAATLPWFEVFCGLLLLAGIAVRGAALVLVAMLVPFTVLIFKHGLELAGALHLAVCAVKFDCGCGHGEVFVCSKLTENSLLILLCCWLIFRRTGRLCARFSVFKPAPAAG